MFSKSLVASALVVVFSAAVNGHAIINPALGVKGTPKSGNVQRPTTGKECGNVNIASTIDTSTPVSANAQGIFTVTAQSFNGGKDGSRQVTMSVNADGTGKKFVAGSVSKNGVLAPASAGTDQITTALPAGTKCSGGKGKNLCLVSFKTAANFGNCVVVSQNVKKRENAVDSAVVPNSSAPASGKSGAVGAATTAEKDQKAKKMKKTKKGKKGKKGKKAGKKDQKKEGGKSDKGDKTAAASTPAAAAAATPTGAVGTRAPRARRAEEIAANNSGADGDVTDDSAGGTSDDTSDDTSDSSADCSDMPTQKRSLSSWVRA